MERLLSAGAIPREGRVLDLCCGGGRHLVAMARRGVEVAGLDLSPSLLRTTNESVRSGKLFIQGLVRGDMRRLPFADGSIAGVTHFFTAFGYFEEDAENFGVFREVARVLQPGGLYLFDFFNAAQVKRIVEGSSGKRLSADGRRVEKVIAMDKEDGGTVVESVRLFEPAELRAALSDVGFYIEEEWGDYTLAPFAEESSPRWLVHCLRR